MEGTAPVLPDYGGACLSSIVPALATRRDDPPPWLPEPVRGAEQVVLLVLDGLGWEQLRRSTDSAPTLASGQGGIITSVVPTTTATALTSITTGRTPAEHGIVGYRIALHADGSAPEVMNVLRWQTTTGDARRRYPAGMLQKWPAFGAPGVPAVTRSEFAQTGFTAAHLGGARLVGWRVPSTLVVEVKRLLHGGAHFVYVYYDGLDKVAHEHGLGDHYRTELAAADRLVGDLLAALPGGAALLLTSDHGQVEVGTEVRMPGPEIMSAVTLLSGEGRFRWLHAKPGASDDLVKAAEEAHGDEAWVRTRQQIVDEGWFGGPLSKEVADRLGDVALVARAPVAFLDPADTGETRLLARHGSLTPAEMQVPLLAWAAS
jgi:predicted AlkP superfamily pyrophosphatase or phosphodiesterase